MLLAEGGGDNDEETAAPGSELGKDEADCVSGDETVGEAGAEGEEGGIDLVEVEGDAGGGEIAAMPGVLIYGQGGWHFGVCGPGLLGLWLVYRSGWGRVG